MIHFESILYQWKQFIESIIITALVANNDQNNIEGNIYSSNKETVYNPAYLPKQKNIFHAARSLAAGSKMLEIGFNTGYSALLLLLSSDPSTQIWCVDLCTNSYLQTCYEILLQNFPNRLHLIRGNSVDILPLLHEQGFLFDLIHIDGCILPFEYEKDLQNSISLLNQKGILINDDTDIEILNNIWTKYRIAYSFEFPQFPIAETNQHALHVFQKVDADFVIDFVTIVYSNSKEIQLLQLQAASFLFVDPNIINNIFILFNDTKGVEEFKSIFESQILIRYPKQFRSKVKVIYLTDFEQNVTLYESCWFTQQALKLLVSNFISTKYYLVLDGKNHFIRPVSKFTLFDINNNCKPFMYREWHNKDMLNFFNNCLNYFDVKFSDENGNENCYVMTITPFMFETHIVKSLLEFVETKENKLFFNFFVTSKMYTEFFLYFAFCLYSNQFFSNYSFHSNQWVYSKYDWIGAMDPMTFTCNSIEDKLSCIHETSSIFVFALHRVYLNHLSMDSKNTVVQYYKHFYHDNSIIELIQNILFH